MAIPIYPRKVEWLEELRYTGTRQKSTGIAFTFLSLDNRQVVPFTTCRDYLHDMVFTQSNRWTTCWYDYYKPGASPPISLTQARILVANTDDRTFPERVERALGFIHDIECGLGIKEKSRAYRIKNSPGAFGQVGAFLYVGSAPWMLAGPMLGLYTLAMRVGYGADREKSYEEVFQDIGQGRVASYSGGDMYTCRTACHGIKRLKEEGYKNIFYTDPRANYPHAAKGNTHSAFGIAGFSCGAARDYINFWYPPGWEAPVDKEYGA